MRFNRLIIGSIFLLLLFLLSYNYVSNGYYSNNSVVDILHDSKDQIFISGSIIQIYDDGFDIYDGNDGVIYHVNTNSTANLNLYVFTFVLGTFNSQNELNAIKIMSLTSSTSLVIFRSLFGLIIFLLIFLTYWKFDFRNIVFVRRK